MFVLHRIVPPASAFTGREFRRLLAQPHHAVRDGLPVTYIRYISPPRARAYATWGSVGRAGAADERSGTQEHRGRPALTSSTPTTPSRPATPCSARPAVRR